MKLLTRRSWKEKISDLDSYAVQLYSREKDLRAVQKQLWHVSISSTFVYADVSDKDIAEQVKGLWN
jgi:site-specific recombinase XerD